MEEQRQLPRLYLTEKSRKEIIAPGNQGLFVDEATGEICYPALQCNSPSCPGQGQGSGDRPFLFIHADARAEIGPDGEIRFTPVSSAAEHRKIVQAKGGTMSPTCPACLESRDLARESAAEKRKYLQWVQPYVLPETAQRTQELDQEHQARIAHMQERRNREPPKE